MIVKLGRAALIILIGASIVPPLLFVISAWGEWKCGVNGFSLTVWLAISTIVATGALAAIRMTLPHDSRFGFKILILLALLLVIGVMWLLWIAPPCPFMSR